MISYARIDDEHGEIFWLREQLEKAVHRWTGFPFVIFQDVEDMQTGDSWEEKLQIVVECVELLVPVLTPSFFTSEICRRETELFLELSDCADRDNLILPIYLTEADVFEDPKLRADHELASKLFQRQYDDWRDFRLKLRDPEARPKIEGLAKTLARAAVRSAKTKASKASATRLWKTGIPRDQLLERPEVVDAGKGRTVFIEPFPGTVATERNATASPGGLQNAFPFEHTIAELNDKIEMLRRLTESQNREIEALRRLTNDQTIGANAREVQPGERRLFNSGFMLVAGVFAIVSTLLAYGLMTVSSTFRDCDRCPEMVVVPPGTFLMGSRSNEAGRDRDELPQHKVTIDYSVALGRYEVRRAEFAFFVDETGHEAKGCRYWDGESWADDGNRDWRDPGYEQTNDDPVVCVSWNDAQAYIAWLSERSGENYRLPSEAEWEYAARAGSTTPLFWDDRPGAPCDYVNGHDLTSKEVNGLHHNTLPCHDEYAQTAPVGSFPANAFGLHEMTGNVWEWVADSWHPNYEGALTDGRPRITGDQTKRVLRGGSWSYNPNNLRVANRREARQGNRNAGDGFRIAKTLGRK